MTDTFRESTIHATYAARAITGLSNSPSAKGPVRRSEEPGARGMIANATGNPADRARTANDSMRTAQRAQGRNRRNPRLTAKSQTTRAVSTPIATRLTGVLPPAPPNAAAPSRTIRAHAANTE